MVAYIGEQRDISIPPAPSRGGVNEHQIYPREHQQPRKFSLFKKKILKEKPDN
jgi:hypothetical protein